MITALARIARAHGVSALLGEFERTARNDVVADLYPRLGFVGAGGDGRWWRGDTGHLLATATPFIRGSDNVVLDPLHPEAAAGAQ